MNPASYLKIWLHRRFIFLLFAAYVLAAIIPSPGLWLKDLDWGTLPGVGGSITTSLLMLGILLFNAGFAVKTEHLQALKRRPSLSFIGIIGKSFLALFWVMLLLLALSMNLSLLWISMLAGFAIVSIMPVATSSTAWAQQTNSNMALSLGLLLLSTVMMPAVIPFMSWLMRQLPASLNPTVSIESTGTFNISFIAIWILLPVVIGRVFQWVLNNKRNRKFSTWIKWVNAINLLLLNYMHGSCFLPQRFDPFQPAPMLSLLLGVAACCLIAFAAGGWLGKVFKVDAPERMALMFGTGMNNNGMALVLASQFLGESGWIGLTIALCTFGQHLVAGSVQILFGTISSIPDNLITNGSILPKTASTQSTSALKTGNGGTSTLLSRSAESNRSHS